MTSTDPKLSASDEALLGEVTCVPLAPHSDRYQLQQLVHHLAARLREVLAERDAYERVNAGLQRQLESQEELRWERMDALEATTGGRSVSEVCESEGRLLRQLAVKDAEIARLQAQLAEARERALEDAMSVCERLEMANVGDSEMLLARRLQSRECAISISALKRQRDSK